MNKYFLLCFCCMLFLSCNKKNTESARKILSVDITPQELSASTLFRKIEIIPLETKPESLITAIGRIIETDDKYYILDDRIAVLFCFTKQGKFLYKIDRNGSGPEEYHLIYETIIKPEENRVYMLSPMGMLYTYTPQGEFIKKDLLPAGGGQDMIEIEKGLIAYWTLLGNPDENKVTFYDIDKGKVAGGFWKDTDTTFMTNMCIDVFYQYNGENFFSTQFANDVYRFTKDSIELAYKWDFGPDNIDLEPYKERVKEDPNVFPQLTETMEIPYFFYRQFQNNNYYYTVLNTWTIDRWRNVFYRKKDGKPFVFDTLEGGAKIKNTGIFTDDYMISVISPEEIETFRNCLSSEEFEKIKNLPEDNNLCLVKYYFK